MMRECNLSVITGVGGCGLVVQDGWSDSLGPVSKTIKHRDTNLYIRLWACGIRLRESASECNELNTRGLSARNQPRSALNRIRSSLYQARNARTQTQSAENQSGIWLETHELQLGALHFRATIGPTYTESHMYAINLFVGRSVTRAPLYVLYYVCDIL